MLPIGAAAADSAFTVAQAAQNLRKEMDRKLVDYPSTRFQNVRAAPATPDPGFTFCGEMNAKNRMGGYNGWERFYGWGGPKGASLILSSEMSPVVENLCASRDFLATDYSKALSAH